MYMNNSGFKLKRAGPFAGPVISLLGGLRGKCVAPSLRSAVSLSCATCSYF